MLMAQLLGVAFTNLFADPVFLKTSAKFAVDVISQEQVVVDATKSLSTALVEP
jgi:hypothetical protein